MKDTISLESILWALACILSLGGFWVIKIAIKRAINEAD